MHVYIYITNIATNVLEPWVSVDVQVEVLQGTPHRNRVALPHHNFHVAPTKLVEVLMDAVIRCPGCPEPPWDGNFIMRGPVDKDSVVGCLPLLSDGFKGIT